MMRGEEAHSGGVIFLSACARFILINTISIIIIIIIIIITCSFTGSLCWFATTSRTGLSAPAQTSIAAAKQKEEAKRKFQTLSNCLHASAWRCGQCPLDTSYFFSLFLAQFLLEVWTHHLKLLHVVSSEQFGRSFCSSGQVDGFSHQI